MKTLKSILLPFAVILLFSLPVIMLQSCDPNDCDEEEDICDSCSIVYKPNVYIYPEQETFLSLQLGFPKGGGVIASIPEYGNGWSVTVTPNGKIDGTYDYLFYESEQPDVWQTKKGWCVKQDSLSTFFTQNLREYGFKGREINDFTEYWVPRLQQTDYYILYPQTYETINSVIELTFSETPDNLLRLFYVVQESNKNISIDAPAISAFNRQGYFVTEWGVVLK